MAETTRRGFIKTTSAGVVGLGMLAIAPHMAAAAPEQHPAPNLDGLEAAGPIVAHVRDAQGEIAVYVGNREVIIHDREIVARLLKAIR
jgi:hypothetical protein